MQLCNICFYVNNVFVHITDKRTPSRPLGEVKLRRAKLVVVRWVTTCEASVMKATYLFSYYYIITIITIILLLIIISTSFIS